MGVEDGDGVRRACRLSARKIRRSSGWPPSATDGSTPGFGITLFSSHGVRGAARAETAWSVVVTITAP